MKYDFIEILISCIVCFAALIGGFRKFKTLHNYSETLPYFSRALLLLITAIILNSLAKGSWSLNYILNFLSLKVAGMWLFRMLASFGYIFLAMGLEALTFVTINSNRTKSGI
jgi:hypothetical protein